MSLQRLQAGLARLVHWIDTGTLTIAALLLLGIVIIDGLSVLFRYVFSAPFSWSEEVMRYCNIWLSFLGAVSAFVRREHMTVELGLTSGNGIIARVLGVLGLLIIMVVAGYMVIYGVRGATANLGQMSPSAGISMAVPYAAVPVAGLLIIVVSLFFLLSNLRRAERQIADSAPREI
ncbi:TRAP transporter small permease [Arsenicitalea aurantiaca]|uniref:TRAP transporter small permease protein n=1 Tax=Arsenicitalea aurantiaca TaxID=1783274 RepID=A0A433X474_9HYPH|nr:TRAP transporter small permease [Arsenicitalea aurantiaca]RUT28867.1 TRAP transporter small permease [Arsenicitalea aurantiaca]